MKRVLILLGAAICTVLLSGDSRATIVAVIDTGADLDHPVLRDHLWVNAGETGLDKNGNDKRTNGIDDDGNGFVDDVHGWNFARSNRDIKDRHGHGTHVSGLIAGPGTRLMILKYSDPGISEAANLKNSVRAIEYAVAMGADIINYSGGGFGRDEAEEEAIRRASERGILFIAAAGNERSNSDRRRYYPADYELPNILSVAAVDKEGRLLSSSNYGARTVHLAAPGDRILSAVPGGEMARMTGTSQAAAFASGIAAQLRREDRALRSPAALIGRLAKLGSREKTLEGKTRYEVRLDGALWKVSATVVP